MAGLFGSSSKKKNTKAMQLRKVKAQIAKIEKKKKVSDELQRAKEKLRKLRG